jgi:hypothetical protein
MKNILALFLSFFLLSSLVLAQDNSSMPPDRQEFDYTYGAFKINYGVRPVSRAASRISFDIDSSDNEFLTNVKDSFQISALNDLKGFSFGVEVGFENKMYLDGKIDIVSRTRGNFNTNMVSLESNLGYNYKLIQKYDVFLRPSFGLFYSRLNTIFGNYISATTLYEPIEVKQSSTLLGIRPSMQIEIPVAKFSGVGSVFARFEAGWNANVYLSRFIKLRAQRTYPNENGNYKYDADRFYLDGDRSNYLIDGKHENRPPTKLGGYFIGIELGFRFWTE